MANVLPRLKRRAEFVRIASGGRSLATPGLVLQMCRRRSEGGKADEAPCMRVGFTASRKVGNAVARNRVRRRLRALAEKVLPVYGESGCDYVLVGRKATLRRPFGALETDLLAALRRLAGGGGRAATGNRRRSRRNAS